MDRALFRERKAELYTTFRFVITLPDRGDDILRAMSVYCDPFTDELWIGRAHIAGERTLAQLLCEERLLEIWMLPRGPGLSRLIGVSFDGLRALPLNLDASADEVALEWVVLKSAKWSPPSDVETPECFKVPAITKTKAGAAVVAAAAGAAEREAALDADPMVEADVRMRVPASMAEAIGRGELRGVSLRGVSLQGSNAPRCKHEFRDGHCRLCGYPGA